MARKPSAADESGNACEIVDTRVDRNRRARRALHLLLLIAGVAAVAGLVQSAAFATFAIYSRSMTPTLEPGDELLAYSVPFWNAVIERGDLVAFEPPVLPRRTELVVKRVVGLAGDEIEIRESTVFVNGTPVRPAPEAWFRDEITSGFGPYVLPRKAVFVLGDHASGSEDSAIYGPISEDRIRFIILLRYRPLQRRCAFPEVPGFAPCDE